MINIQYFEPTLSRTYFHGSKLVRAIEALLYFKPYVQSSVTG